MSGAGLVKLPFVSVVIPSLNEERHIVGCLQSLGRLRYPARFEVILVDNGSTDRTVDLAHGVEKTFALTVLSLPGASIARMRNEGVARCRGELVAFLDADCTVGTAWMEAGARRLGDSTIGVAGCSHVLPPEATWVSRAWHIGIERNRYLGDRRTLPSGNMFVVKSVFEELGGFDESLETNEDYELCFRYRQRGLRVFSDPDILAVHHGIPGTLGEFCRQQHWHGRHVTRALLKHSRSIRSLQDVKQYKAVAYGMYSLLGHAWLLGAVAAVIFGAEPGPAVIPPIAAILVPAASLSFGAVRGGGQGVRAWAKLLLLYYLYGCARATSTLRAARG